MQNYVRDPSANTRSSYVTAVPWRTDVTTTSTTWGWRAKTLCYWTVLITLRPLRGEWLRPQTSTQPMGYHVILSSSTASFRDQPLKLWRERRYRARFLSVSQQGQQYLRHIVSKLMIHVIAYRKTICVPEAMMAMCYLIIVLMYKLSAVHCQVGDSVISESTGLFNRYSVSANEIFWQKKSAIQIVSFNSF